MHRLTLLLLLGFAVNSSCAQQTDTLTVFYSPDEYRLSKADKGGLDAFLRQGWDRLSIRSYTDETDDDDYNLELSRRRAEGVYRYCLSRNMAAAAIAMQYFGESVPLADNSTEDGRALNRQTTIVGYRYPRITPKPVADPAQPVTTTFNDGFIITYRPGSLPESWQWYFESGVSPFTLVANTLQMRQAGLYTNTTRGEILSSVMVFCGERLNPCKLDSPILIKVPIPFQTKCPLDQIKFYNAVAERGRQVWQEQNKQLCPEIIDGRQYISLLMDDFCQCINFDIKVPECYDVDSTQLLVNTRIKSLTTELLGLNSVYLPRKTSDSTHSILFVKDEMNKALVSFSAYYGKRYLKRFTNKPPTIFPYDSDKRSYVVSVDSVRFYLPGLRGYDMVMKVNGDRYRTFLEKDRCQFVYVKRKDESIAVDLWVRGKKGKLVEYKNQPLAAIPFDGMKGEYVIDRGYLKELELKKAVTRR